VNDGGQRLDGLSGSPVDGDNPVAAAVRCNGQCAAGASRPVEFDIHVAPIRRVSVLRAEG
jgi:hypothetical protein